jgi:hypothetical protein
LSGLTAACGDAFDQAVNSAGRPRRRDRGSSSTSYTSIQASFAAQAAALHTFHQQCLTWSLVGPLNGRP